MSIQTDLARQDLLQVVAGLLLILAFIVACHIASKWKK